ncbi:MAG: 50S ribosomal protein L3 [Proteobacteria bacterium]|nr:50S ribosomal protein L3 [Pseudomonadota bacterium]
MKGIIGRKLGMTQIFLQDGNAAPVTVVEAGPCPIIQKKTLEKDGYEALQLAFLPKKRSRVNKPRQGHFAKADKGTYYILREIRTNDMSELEVGHEITVDIFKPGEIVDVIGTSKGRGFTGVMKRHGFKGSPRGHGTHEYFRHGGAIGAAAYPAHTFKGMKMPGQFGNRRITVQNLEILDVRQEKNLLLIKGALPGWRNGIVIIQEAKKRASRPKKSAEITESSD